MRLAVARVGPDWFVSVKRAAMTGQPPVGLQSVDAASAAVAETAQDPFHQQQS
jgi:hypothetical protein